MYTIQFCKKLDGNENQLTHKRAIYKKKRAKMAYYTCHAWHREKKQNTV